MHSRPHHARILHVRKVLQDRAHPTLLAHRCFLLPASALIPPHPALLPLLYSLLHHAIALAVRGSITDWEARVRANTRWYREMSMSSAPVLHHNVKLRIVQLRHTQAAYPFPILLWLSPPLRGATIDCDPGDNRTCRHRVRGAFQLPLPIRRTRRAATLPLRRALVIAHVMASTACGIPLCNLNRVACSRSS